MMNICDVDCNIQEHFPDFEFPVINGKSGYDEIKGAGGWWYNINKEELHYLMEFMDKIVLKNIEDGVDTETDDMEIYLTFN